MAFMIPAVVSTMSDDAPDDTDYDVTMYDIISDTTKSDTPSGQLREKSPYAMPPTPEPQVLPAGENQSELTDDWAQLAMEMLQRGDLMKPIIKDELKTTIKAKRRARGEEDIDVEQHVVRSEQLSEEDLERRQQRRENNKLAAQKCRVKRRNKADGLKKLAADLQAKNDSLRQTIRARAREKRVLFELLGKHHPCIDTNKLKTFLASEQEEL